FHLQRETGTVARLMSEEQKPGPALGVFDASNYQTFHSKLKLHDAVMLFTDGLYEIEGSNEVYYDMDQLTVAVQKRCKQPTVELFDGLLNEIRQFAARKE